MKTYKRTYVAALMLLVFAILLCGCGGGGLMPDVSFEKLNTTTNQDDNKEPLPAPANFKIDCGETSLTLSWDKISKPNNSGYVVYSCSYTTCTGTQLTIDNPDTTSVEIPGSNGSVYCYSVSGQSSVSTQGALPTSIKCQSVSTQACG